MKKMKQQEVQPLLLNLLKALKEYFDKHNLEFYLTGGTLLGAIRHHGFIPWDDDIDVIVRKDVFEALFSLAEKDPFIDEKRRYRILCPSAGTNIKPVFQLVDTKTVVYGKNVEKQYANGLWIDIFCMSYWPDDIKDARRMFRRQKLLKKMLQVTICGNLRDKKYKLIYPLIFPVKQMMIRTGLDGHYWSKKILQLGEYPPSSYIGNLCWASSLKDRYPIHYFSEGMKVQFEGNEYDAPKEYDAILTQFYGNYMQLPPESERINHSFDAYYID